MLFLGFSIITQSTATAQVKSDTVTVSTVYNDIKTQSPKIEKALTELAKSLKVTVNKVWDILVKQQLVVGITGLIFIFTNCIFIYFWKRYYRYVESKKYPSYDPGQWPMVIVLGVVIFCITIMNLLNFETVVTAFFNPEYGAMQTIAEIATKIQ